MKVIIIGAGLTGLSAAENLKNKLDRIFEKDLSCGGLAQTKELHGNFRHDITGHFLHLHDDKIEKKVHELFKNSDSKLLQVERKSYVFRNNTFIPFPFQSHLNYLPDDIRKECILGFLKSLESNKTKSHNFHEWMIARYGDGITEYFMRPYNEKIWKYPLKEIKSDVVRRFFPDPSPEEIIAGALSDRISVKGYNAVFYYPQRGISELTARFMGKIDDKKIFTETEVKKVLINKKRIITDKKEEFDYDYLISTCPLKELVLKIIEPKPRRLTAYAEKLRHTSVLNINLEWKGTPGKKVPKGTHWLYFPEKKYLFYRVGFLPAVSEKMAPKGCFSCYTEIAYKENYLPSTHKKWMSIAETVKEQLKEAGIIPKGVNIHNGPIEPIKYAYVLYDDNWKKARTYILSRLEEKGIFSGGRYGAWEYSSMDQAIKWGEKLAKKCVKK
ncbi:protoporphyrinogen/coproporphyrinogen oxidase [Elusimicrobiota bacterium]